MASLPTIKTFSPEDFPSQASWIGTLFYPLNRLLTTLYAALNNGLTLKENCQAQVTTLPVLGSSPSVSFSYKYSPASPIAIQIGNVVQTDTPAVTLSVAVGCLWTISSGIITATLQGLDVNSEYNITFIIWGG